VLRWVGLATNLGAALVGVVAVQAVGALMQGLFSHEGPADDVFHRIGYGFERLGIGSTLTLGLALVLISLPLVTGRAVGRAHEQTATMALKFITALSVLVGLGMIMAVRYELALDTTRGQATPVYGRLGLMISLLGVVGTAAVVGFGAAGLRKLRPPAGTSV